MRQRQQPSKDNDDKVDRREHSGLNPDPNRHGPVRWEVQGARRCNIELEEDVPNLKPDQLARKRHLIYDIFKIARCRSAG